MRHGQMTRVAAVDRPARWLAPTGKARPNLTGQKADGLADGASGQLVTGEAGAGPNTTGPDVGDEKLDTGVVLRSIMI